MKNMRISMKLIVGFLIATVLTAIVGAVGIYGLLTSSNTSSAMYDVNLMPLPYMSKVIETMQRMRVNTRQFIINVVTEDANGVEDTHKTIEEYKKVITENLDAFDETVDDPEVQAIFNNARDLYDTDYKDHLERVYQFAKDSNYMGIIADLDTSKAIINEIVAGFDQCMALKVDDAAESDTANDSMSRMLLIVIIAVLVAAVVISMFLAFYISRLISKPITMLSEFMKKAGTTGDISLKPEEERIIGEMGTVRDEIGQTISNSSSFINHVTYVAHELETIANGDLTTDVKLLSEKDVMGLSLKQTVESLNNMFGNIQSSTTQVSVGAKQVADGAQSLAQGATEQAASIQQLSSSIAQIAEKTKANAEIAGRTSKLSEAIKENAEKGNSQMNDMITAVKQINDASQSISKIIKTIDDIAFQTNILALNAAVEAARAGQHGKGFAVVAEEVRNLASKSAEAAKDTGDMIQNSMEKAELGSQIANDTATSLKDIVSGINESSQLVGEIARASEEQSLGISQINTGIDQVAQVVQQNSATAEQSAAASEEMSSQSSILEELISQFKLKDSNSLFTGLPSAGRSRSQPAAVSRISAGAGDFGKY